MQYSCDEDLRRRVQKSFAGDARDLVLKAHDCAAERFGNAFADQTRAADALLSHHADPIVVAGCHGRKFHPLRHRAMKSTRASFAGRLW